MVKLISFSMLFAILSALFVSIFFNEPGKRASLTYSEIIYRDYDEIPPMFHQFLAKRLSLEEYKKQTAAFIIYNLPPELSFDVEKALSIIGKNIREREETSFKRLLEQYDDNNNQILEDFDIKNAMRRQFERGWIRDENSIINDRIESVMLSDLNKDGVVSQEDVEIRIMNFLRRKIYRKNPKLESDLLSFDINRDGHLSEEEIIFFVHKSYGTIDLNGDKSISDEEYVPYYIALRGDNIKTLKSKLNN